jgi:hypothetical protein
MSTIAAAKPSEKGVKGMFKRLTTKLKRKGDKHKDEEETEHNTVGPHEEVEVRVEQGRGHGDDAKKHMKNMLGTEDIDQHDEDEEVGKSKTYSEDAESKSKVKKKNKVEHLLRRSKKYELTKSASKGHLHEAEDEADHDNHSNANKAKEEDSDANIQAVEEHHKEKGSTIKKTKEEKKRQRKQRKERKKSLRKSVKQTNEQTAAVGQNDPVPAAVSQVVATAQPAPAPAVIPATGRPTNGGLIRPLSCPPQPFNGEVLTSHSFLRLRCRASLTTTYVFVPTSAVVHLRLACDHGCDSGRCLGHRPRTPAQDAPDDLGEQPAASLSLIG